MAVPSDSVLDYSKVNKIALIGGLVVVCKLGSYREYTPTFGKREVFECETGTQGARCKVIGLTDSIIAMWFSQEVDN
jgi:hypothetical protein